MAAIDVAAVVAGTQDPAALAVAQGASWSERVTVERGSAAVPEPVLSAVFAQNRPAAGSIGMAVTPLDGGDEAVVLIFSARAGIPEDIPSADREQGQQLLVGEVAQAEINAFAVSVRDTAKVRVPDQILNPDL
jgi:hypothetical protein